MDTEKRVVLVLVDGMRPDGLQEAETPAMDQLIAAGASTFSARTVVPSISLACITSLFLGVPPERHGITTNVWAPSARPVPGLIETIQQSGGQAASFYNWEELRDLSRPGALEAAFCLRDCYTPQADAALTDLAIAWLRANPMMFSFVYLGHTDIAGHAFGWMSEPYLAAIANADRCIARLVEIFPEEALVVVTADHGGHAQTHGTELLEDLQIPMILRGPGISGGTRIPGEAAILDLAPTICGWLGITPPREWVGKDLLR